MNSLFKEGSTAITHIYTLVGQPTQRRIKDLTRRSVEFWNIANQELFLMPYCLAFFILLAIAPCSLGVITFYSGVYLFIPREYEVTTFDLLVTATHYTKPVRQQHSLVYPQSGMVGMSRPQAEFKKEIADVNNIWQKIQELREATGKVTTLRERTISNIREGHEENLFSPLPVSIRDSQQEFAIKCVLESLSQSSGYEIDSGKICDMIESLIALIVALVDCTTYRQFFAILHPYFVRICGKTFSGLIREYLLKEFSLVEQSGEISHDGKGDDILSVIRKMKDAKVTWQTIVGSPAGEKIMSLISCIVGMGLVDKDIMSPSIKGIKLFSLQVKKRQTTCTDFCGVILDTAMFFLEGGYAYFMDRDLKGFLYGGSKLRDLEEKYLLLEMAMPFVRTGDLNKVGMTEHELENLFDQLLTYLSEAIQVATESFTKKSLVERRIRVGKLRSEFWQTRVKGGLRIAPFCLGFYGSSSVGKSSVSQISMVSMLRANGFACNEDSLVTLNEADKYMSNYRAGTTGVFIDDLGNTKAEFVDGSPLEKILRICNNVKSTALMAEAELKGKISVSPMVVCVTKNVKDSCASTYSNEPVSIMRRENVTVTVTVKPEFQRQGGMLDPAKVLQAFPDDPVPDCWNFLVERTIGIDNVCPGQPQTISFEIVQHKGKNLIDVDIYELLDFLYDESQAWFAQQRKLIEASTNMDQKIPFCRFCDRHIRVCSCIKRSRPKPKLECIPIVEEGSEDENQSVPGVVIKRDVIFEEYKNLARQEGFITPARLEELQTIPPDFDEDTLADISVQDQAGNIPALDSQLREACAEMQDHYLGKPYSWEETKSWTAISALKSCFSVPLNALPASWFEEGAFRRWLWRKPFVQRMYFRLCHRRTQISLTLSSFCYIIEQDFLRLFTTRFWVVCSRRVMYATGVVASFLFHRISQRRQYVTLRTRLVFYLVELWARYASELPGCTTESVNDFVGPIYQIEEVFSMFVGCVTGLVLGSLLIGYYTWNYGAILYVLVFIFSYCIISFKIMYDAALQSVVRGQNNHDVLFGRLALGILGPTTLLIGLYFAIRFFKNNRQVLDQGNFLSTSEEAVLAKDARCELKDTIAEDHMYFNVPNKESPATNLSRTTTLEQATTKIQKNQYFVSYEKNGSQFGTSAIFLRSNVAIVPYHFVKNLEGENYYATFRKCEDGRNAYFNCDISEEASVRIGDLDFALMWVPSGGSHGNITEYLPRAHPPRVENGRLLMKDRNGNNSEHHLIFKSGPTNNGSYRFQGGEYELDFDTWVGMCMSPILSCAQSYILGFHLGGGTGRHKRLGVAGTLRIEDIIPALQALNKKEGVNLAKDNIPTPHYTMGVDYILSDGVHYKSDVNRLDNSGCLMDYEGMTLGRSRFYSRVKQSPISDAVEEVFEVPNTWGPPRFNKNSWYNSLIHFVKPSCGVPYKLLVKAVEDYKKPLLEQLKLDYFRRDIVPLTDMQCICGIDGKMFVDKIPRDTSPGFPFSGAKRAYMYELSSFDYPEFSCPFKLDLAFWGESENIKNSYREGKRAKPIFKACLKDEPTKVTKEKVRVFQACPLAFSILVRKYFLPIARFLSLNIEASECAVGLDPMSPDWQDLMDYVGKYGSDRVLAGDYSKYDTRMPAQLTLAAFRILIDIAKATGNYTDDDITIMEGIATDICYPLVAYNGDLIQLYGSNPSGQNLTVYINSIVNSLLIRCAFYKTNEGDFKDSVALVTYGDDFISTVKENCSLNFISMQEFIASIDMKLTMPDKSDNVVPFLDMSDCDFLKRRSVYHEKLGHAVGALSEDSIFKMLHSNLVTKGNSHAEISKQCLSTAALEWFYHGEDVCNRRRLGLREIIEKVGYPKEHCPRVYETYNETVEYYKKVHHKG